MALHLHELLSTPEPVGPNPMMVDVAPVAAMLELHLVSGVLTIVVATEPGVRSRADFRVLAAYWLVVLAALVVLPLLQSQTLGRAWYWLLLCFAPLFVLAAIKATVRRAATT